MKLIPMTDFVLKTVQTPNLNEAICWEQTEYRLNKIYEYSLFLKQPLKLEMFVPLDKNGNFLEEPTHLQKMQAGWMDNPIDDNFYRVNEYNKAVKKVIFSGFEVQNNAGILRFYNKESDLKRMWSINYSFNVGFQDKFKTIEDLTTLGIELKSYKNNKEKAKQEQA